MPASTSVDLGAGIPLYVGGIPILIAPASATGSVMVNYGTGNGTGTSTDTASGTLTFDVLGVGVQTFTSLTASTTNGVTTITGNNLVDSFQIVYSGNNPANASATLYTGIPPVQVEAFGGTGNVSSTFAPCFVRGTLIATPAGERPVEDLRIGDLVTTMAGEEKPVIWIGTRSYGSQFASKKVWPVRIAAGALDDSLPRRDLLVSPNHGVLVDGVLIPALELVNGVTITQAATGEQIDYFHLELEEHDLVMAEGVPNETFVDDGSRMLFENAHEYYALHPHREDVDAVYATMRVEDGEELQAVRERLAARAGLLQVAA